MNRRIFLIAALSTLAGCGKLTESTVAPNTGVTPDSSWSGIPKPSVGPANAQDRRAGPFPGGDWSSRVLWEARYALSRPANGTSVAPINNDPGRGYWGDWDYANSDQFALGKTRAESNIESGPLGPGGGHYKGGWCTFFVRLVLYRSTYWNGNGWHLTMPAFPSGSVYSWCGPCCMTQNYGQARPGWVIMSPSVPHAAILESRGYSGGQLGWWVIDSNFTGGNGGFYISKHFFSDATLASKGYWAWLPNWATTN